MENKSDSQPEDSIDLTVTATQSYIRYIWNMTILPVNVGVCHVRCDLQ